MRRVRVLSPVALGILFVLVGAGLCYAAGETADVEIDPATVTVECKDTETLMVVVTIAPAAELEPSTFYLTFDTTYVEVTDVQPQVPGDTGLPTWNNTTGVIEHTQAWAGSGPTGGDIDVLEIEFCAKATTPVGSPTQFDFVGGAGNTVIWVDGADATGTLTASDIIIEDTTPPAITLVGNATITLECCVDTYTEQGATVADDCCITDTATIGGDTVDACEVGTYIVTYNVVDCAGNPADEVTRTVIVEDTIDPTFTVCPNDLVLACDHENNEDDIDNWLDSAIAADTCGDVTITDNYTGLLGGCSSDTGTALVTFTATDESGNFVTCQATLTVLPDTTPPQFVELPKDLLVTADELWKAGPASLEATDECDPDVAVTYLREVGVRSGTAYTLERVYAATDDCGNQTTHTQAVTVVVIPDDVTVESGGSIAPANTGSIDEIQDRYIETVVEYTDTDMGGCPRTIVRTWTVSDRFDWDKFAEGSQEINILDTEAPQLCLRAGSKDGELAVVLSSSEPLAASWVELRSTDTKEWQGALVSVGDESRWVIPPELPTGAYEVKATAEDSCGNLGVTTASLILARAEGSPVVPVTVESERVSLRVDLNESYVAEVVAVFVWVQESWTELHTDPGIYVVLHAPGLQEAAVREFAIGVRLDAPIPEDVALDEIELFIIPPWNGDWIRVQDVHVDTERLILHGRIEI